MDKLFIFKFGGSCLKNKEALEKSLKIINEYQKNGKIIIVTSAFFGITNKLLDWIKNASENGVESQSIEEITSLMDYHRQVVRDMIDNQKLQKESIDFVQQKENELKDLLPQMLNKEVSKELTDTIVSYGERISTYIYAMYLRNKGLQREYISADEKVLYTNNTFGNALPLLEKVDKTITERIEPLLSKKIIPIFTGYYGCTEDGKITTLGRGGSDFTATIIAYTFAEKYKVKVVFWKDTYGILTTNPKYEPKAKLLKNLSFAEAKQLAFFGTSILHPLCLITAEKRPGVDVELRNYEDPFNEKSTIISTQPFEQQSVIKGITTIEKIAMVTIEGETMVNLPGVAAKIFTTMGDNSININFISQSSAENNITFGVSEKDGFRTGQVLAGSKYFGNHWLKVRVEHDVSLVAVVGVGMANTPGVSGKVFTTIGDAGVNIRAIAQGSSELNISFVVTQQDLQKAIHALYQGFIESNGETTNFW